MTYAEKIYSYTGAKLIEEAEKLGVKLNKKGNTLKESKAKAADKIIVAYEAQHAEPQEVAETEEPAEVLETVEAVETETAPAEEPKKEKKARVKEKKARDKEIKKENKKKKK